jgi:CheY-like chemotaxis protein
MGFSSDSRARFNLEQVSILLLEETPLGMSVLVQILNGFGARKLHRCDSVAKAERVVRETELDLLIVDAMASGGGYDFVHWLRSSGIRPNCYAPALGTVAHISSWPSRSRPRPCWTVSSGSPVRGAGSLSATSLWDPTGASRTPEFRKALRQGGGERIPSREETRVPSETFSVGPGACRKASSDE